MTTTFNILEWSRNNLNHLFIMNINKVTGELVSSREYLLLRLVAMETIFSFT